MLTLYPSGGIGFGVFAGQQARGALVVAADFALGELVKQPLALIVERLGSHDFTAQIAKVGEPFACIERKLRVDVLADLLGEGRTGAGGRDGDLKVAAPNDGREVEVAEGWVVDGVAEDALFCRFLKDGTVDGGHIGRSNDKEASRQVALSIGALDGIESRLRQRDFGCARWLRER